VPFRGEVVRFMQGVGIKKDTKSPCRHEEQRGGVASVYPLLAGNNDAGNNPESPLREDKPEPVNMLVEHRINDSENTVKQTRPQDGRYEASQQDWPAGKHRKHLHRREGRRSKT
jgi:hypothetical protein